MSKSYFTIGMAGHIDHGKTTLTKALTNVDTDRLKEEKERQISIELGFAPLYEDEGIQISVVDVPGHERFIRQMIAGVAGIDLVVLVVAADEGVMPQTREHLDILRFLGIKNGIIAITKIDRVEEDLIEIVKEDILEELKGTVFESAPFVLIDSLSNKGIVQLKSLIINTLKLQTLRDATGTFRLPIDQVFTVKGQGTVVRGTVYEGTIEEGQLLKILPKGFEVRARQIQTHHQSTNKAFAGQRAAINLSGVSKEEIKRGDVLVSDDHFIVTKTVDVAILMTSDLDYIVKQRMPIKCHIGTAEVMGRIVFFDRNELKEENEEILCQLRLDEEIVTKRGDRFILRRPSPPETIGGGWIIDPQGKKYRYGMKTVEALQNKKEGSPQERITAALLENKSLTILELLKRTSLDHDTLKRELENEPFLQFNQEEYTLQAIASQIEEVLYDHLNDFHKQFPMKSGMNKAELLQGLQKLYSKALIEFVLEKGINKEIFARKDQYVYLVNFTPHIPLNWQKRTNNMLESLCGDGLKVRYVQDYLKDAGLPAALIPEIKRFLEEQKQIIALDDQYYLHNKIFTNAIERLKNYTGREFEIGEAKDILELSRKLIILLLEKLDSLDLTKRVGNKRIWNK